MSIDTALNIIIHYIAPIGLILIGIVVLLLLVEFIIIIIEDIKDNF